MAFTYNTPPQTDRDELRIILTDITEDSGPTPSNGNLDDALLNHWLNEAGDVHGAAALAFEHLAVLWINNPVFGPGELSTIHVSLSEKYLKMAERYRAMSSSDVVSAAVVRVGSFTKRDAYSSGGTEYTVD